MSKGRRPYMLIGHHPQLTIAQARYLAETIRTIGDKGVNVRESHDSKLISDLKKKGTSWHA